MKRGQGFRQGRDVSRFIYGYKMEDTVKGGRELRWGELAYSHSLIMTYGAGCSHTMNNNYGKQTQSLSFGSLLLVEIITEVQVRRDGRRQNGTVSLETVGWGHFTSGRHGLYIQ